MTVCERLCVSVCVSVMPVFVRGHPLSVWFIMCLCGAVFKNILTSGQAAPALVLFIDFDNELAPTAGPTAHRAEQSREI